MTQARQPKVITCKTLPKKVAADAIYRLLPRNPDLRYYTERTDRNIGWITREEQEMLRNAVVGIAGCGGMGGLLASIFVRLGVGEVRIADCEEFDISNINRQFAAARNTVGKSKVIETARMVRAISDDTTLVVYPQGINEETAAPFLEGCDIVCDEIEFWAIGARILLHKSARECGITILNCNTVGFGTRLFSFEPDGYTMEQLLDLTYREAKLLQERIQSKTASADEVHKVMRKVLAGLVPELPEYAIDTATYSNVEVAKKRLFEENRATIVSTNPPMASGFLADHVLFHLLRKSSIRRNLMKPVPAPGYLYFDAGFHCAKVIERKEADRG